MTAPRSTQVILSIWLAACLLFASFPGIDLAVTGLFYDPATGQFPLGGHAALQALREVIWNALNLLALLCLFLGLQGLFTRRAMRIPARIWGFCVALILLGPGILVNLILKSHWGRARPAQLELFGGNARFTPPLQISDQCASNCSFVSGEAAFAACGAIILGLLLWHVVPARRRRWLLAALALFAVAAASMRVMTGRHFLSDVVWSFILMGTLAHLLARLFRLAPIHSRVTAGALRADAQSVTADLAGAGHRALRRARTGLLALRDSFARNRRP